MKNGILISSWDIPSLPIVGSNARFPVAPHLLCRPQLCGAPEGNGRDGREQPFFFAKSAHDSCPRVGKLHFPR